MNVFFIPSKLHSYILYISYIFHTFVYIHTVHAYSHSFINTYFLDDTIILNTYIQTNIHSYIHSFMHTTYKQTYIHTCIHTVHTFNSAVPAERKIEQTSPIILMKAIKNGQLIDTSNVCMHVYVCMYVCMYAFQRLSWQACERAI